MDDRAAEDFALGKTGPHRSLVWDHLAGIGLGGLCQAGEKSVRLRASRRAAGVWVSAIRAVFGWLGGKAFLYVALVLAILAGAALGPWLRSEWTKANRQAERVGRFETVAGKLDGERKLTQRRLDEAASAARSRSIDELDAAIVGAERAKVAAESLRRSDLSKAKSLLSGDAEALLVDGRLELEIEYRDREIVGLTGLRDQIAARTDLARFPSDLATRLEQAKADAAGAMSACRSSALDLAEFEARWEFHAFLYDRQQHRRLSADLDERCRTATAAADAQRAAAVALKSYHDARRAYAHTRGWTGGEVGSVTRALQQQIDKERAEAKKTWPQKLSLWADRTHLSRVLWQAAAALASIIALPFLVRLFCYYALAPIVMRRPAIRLPAPRSSSAAIAPAGRSTTSLSLTLAAGEELLVRQDFLQTSSAAGGKSTQWLLDWRHPLTSLASGLTFMTRIRGEGEATTVSAVRDPFAEVTLMTLPPGALCVLQPRALAAAVQPIEQPLVITSHWRLLSIKAWLTLQLRYLVFHGPAKLVLKGGRGIRVERAERGRIFAQDQLVGFSTDLGYSVARTETFWPYFLGREQLLKDQVTSGQGVLIVEEAPLAGQGRGQSRRGLEGMIDAAMKLFGI